MYVRRVTYPPGSRFGFARAKISGAISGCIYVYGLARLSAIVLSLYPRVFVYTYTRPLCYIAANDDSINISRLAAARRRRRALTQCVSGIACAIAESAIYLSRFIADFSPLPALASSRVRATANAYLRTCIYMYLLAHSLSLSLPLARPSFAVE